MSHFDKLKYFFRLLTFLGILPVWNINKREVQTSKRCKLYSLMMLILVTTIYISLLISRVFYIFPMRKSTIISVDTVNYLIQYVLNVVSICQINYFATKKLEKILNVLHFKDKKLVRHQYFVIIFNHLLIFFLIFYDCYIWLIEHEISIAEQVLYLQYFQKYHVQMVVLLLYVLIGAIEVKYRSFNIFLLNCLSKFNVKERTTLFSKVSRERDQDFRNVSIYCDLRNMFELYSEIGDLLETFNDVFGWIIFLIIINLFTDILSSLNFVIIEFGAIKKANIDDVHNMVIIILSTFLGVVSRFSNTFCTITFSSNLNYSGFWSDACQVIRRRR